MRSFYLALAFLAAAPSLAADTDPSTPGALQVTRPGDRIVEMPLRHTRVSIEVSAFVARTTIEQIFANPFDEPVEAVYTFPLGDRAAVDDFELSVGDRTIRGTIRRREEARAVYEEARSAGFQAALLEQERPNIFTQSVANLEPRKEITVRIRTVEVIRYERGVYRLTFPLVVGPRYIPGGGAVRDAARIAPPVLRPGMRSGNDVEIKVAIDAGVPLTALTSPSQKIVSQALSLSRARVHLADGDAIPNKDFQLRWSVAATRPAVGLLTHCDGGDGFFTLLVQPKGEVGATEAMPKEIVFVLDTSGSMSGVPIEASKRLVAKALREMGPRDTFNLIRFAGDNEVFAKESLPNDDASIESAIAWLNRQQGGGGTELLAALRSAFTRPSDPNRVRIVIFLTDGFVGNDPQILGEIGRVLGEARIYTVGIGSSVNHFLLDRMAGLGNGAYVVVRPDERADDALEAFRSWVTRPYLTDLTIDWGSLPVADLQPERLRDLGSGQTLTVVGRYLGAYEGDVTLRGKLGGRYWEQRIHVVLPESQPRNESLASLWARNRIEDLILASPEGLADSVRAEVTALALEYRLMSAYTSFVAVDDTRNVNPKATSQTIHQALPIPDGVSFEGIFGKDGPPGLKKTGPESEPDDEFREVTGGVPGGTFGGFARVLHAAPPSRPAAKVAAVETVATQTVRAETSLASGDRDFKFSREIIQDLPVAGRFYQNVLSLAPGVEEPDGDGNPNVPGPVGEPADDPAGRAHLIDVAFRVLADLADDGKLSPSEGRPALAALLAAQRSTGAIASDVAVHAVATWAIAEAAVVLSADAMVTNARPKAIDHLVEQSGPGAKLDADSARWARLVLGALRPDVSVNTPQAAGEPSQAYVQLREALAAARSGSKPAAATGRTPFERLIASIGRGNLKVVKT